MYGWGHKVPVIPRIEQIRSYQYLFPFWARSPHQQDRVQIFTFLCHFLSFILIEISCNEILNCIIDLIAFLHDNSKFWSVKWNTKPHDCHVLRLFDGQCISENQLKLAVEIAVTERRNWSSLAVGAAIVFRRPMSFVWILSQNIFKKP